MIHNGLIPIVVGASSICAPSFTLATTSIDGYNGNGGIIL
jgi:hypothetical protein